MGCPLLPVATVHLQHQSHCCIGLIEEFDARRDACEGEACEANVGQNVTKCWALVQFDFLILIASKLNICPNPEAWGLSRPLQTDLFYPPLLMWLSNQQISNFEVYTTRLRVSGEIEDASRVYHWGLPFSKLIWIFICWPPRVPILVASTSETAKVLKVGREQALSEQKAWHFQGPSLGRRSAGQNFWPLQVVANPPYHIHCDFLGRPAGNVDVFSRSALLGADGRVWQHVYPCLHWTKFDDFTQRSMTSFCISLAHHLQHAEHADHPDDQSILFAGLQPLYDSMPAQWASNDSSGHVYNSKNACAYAKLTIYLHTDSCIMFKKKCLSLFVFAYSSWDPWNPWIPHGFSV